MKLHMLEGEKIIKKTCPHILAMLYLYLIWLYVGCVGVIVIVFRENIDHWVENWVIGNHLPNIAYLSLWSLCLFIPSIVLAIFRINLRWVLISVLVCTTGILIDVYDQQIIAFLKQIILDHERGQAILSFLFSKSPFPFHTMESENYFLVIVSCLGILLSNIYRRSHAYYITNRRIVTKFGFVSTRERDLLYSKIDDLIIHQGIIGRICSFGTIIPISASGIGTGNDLAFASGEIGMQLSNGPKISVAVGGGKTVTVPRAPSFYSLYGIADPGKLKKIIIQQMEQREYGHNFREHLRNNL